MIEMPKEGITIRDFDITRYRLEYWIGFRSCRWGRREAIEGTINEIRDIFDKRTRELKQQGPITYAYPRLDYGVED